LRTKTVARQVRARQTTGRISPCNTAEERSPLSAQNWSGEGRRLCVKTRAELWKGTVVWGAEGMEVRLGFFEKNTARGVRREGRQS